MHAPVQERNLVRSVVQATTTAFKRKFGEDLATGGYLQFFKEDWIFIMGESMVQRAKIKERR